MSKLESLKNSPPRKEVDAERGKAAASAPAAPANTGAADRQAQADKDGATRAGERLARRERDSKSARRERQSKQ